MFEILENTTNSDNFKKLNENILKSHDCDFPGYFQNSHKLHDEDTANRRFTCAWGSLHYVL